MSGGATLETAVLVPFGSHQDGAGWFRFTIDLDHRGGALIVPGGVCSIYKLNPDPVLEAGDFSSPLTITLDSFDYVVHATDGFTAGPRVERWGEWQAGNTYWAYAGGNVAAEWDYAASTGYVPTSDATFLAEFAKAAALEGTTSTPVIGDDPARPMFLVDTASGDHPSTTVGGTPVGPPGDSSRTNYISTGRATARGFDATVPRATLPDPARPPGASTAFEFETDTADYLGQARLHVTDYSLSNAPADKLDLRMEFRALAASVADLSTPLPYDTSGPLLFSTAAIATTSTPVIVEVGAYTHPVDGEFLVTQSANVVSVTPTVADTTTDNDRFALGAALMNVEYHCRTPRYRWLYIEAGILITDEINTLPGLRQVQRGDALGIGGVPRAVQNRSQQSSLRRGTAYY